MGDEPEYLVLELLRGIRVDAAETKAELKAELAEVRADLKAGLADVRAEFKSDMHSLRADVAADMIVMRKEIGEQITGLRRAVMEYHSSVIGHRVIISELEARVRRVEQHLDLPSMDAH